MKKESLQKTKMLAAVFAACCSPVAAGAQEHVEADLGADLVSGYLWRGQDLGNVSIQPSVSVSYKGFWVGAWGSVGLDKDDTKEIDLTVGYAAGGLQRVGHGLLDGRGRGVFPLRCAEHAACV